MPVNLIVLGMAGTGKTTFVDQFSKCLISNGKNPYIVNLDPAVHHIPYSSNIDIRDTIKYKEVMNQYGFGPNGAIMTSLNFFTSQFHKVVDIISSKKEHDFIIFDTPGQIEVFTWSASGMIITETLSSVNPTLILYVVDTPRCRNPVTFMSNMLYACSIMYKMRLPLLCVFNKTDIISSDFATKWMTDFEEFQEALSAYNTETGPASSNVDGEKYANLPCYNVGSQYMTSLTNSMSLVLDEFYSTISSTGFSSKTGDGYEKLMEELAKGVIDYETNYKASLEKEKTRRLRHMMLDESDPEEVDEDKISVKSSNSKTGSRPPSPAQTMLIDMAGHEDKVDDDLNIHLNAEEESPSSILDKENDDKIKLITQKVMTKCKIDE